jgi:ribosomal protein S12 methylthiotransferase accessory factor
MHSPGTVGTGIDVQRDEAIVRALDMELEMRSESIGARHLPHFRAIARTHTPHETIYGCGSGHTPEIARHGALMECAERYAQFGCVEPRISVVDAYAALLPHAISPAACGLYSRAQYEIPNFGLAPFSESDRLEWVEVHDLASSACQLIPVEFVFPRARLNRRLLVAETSSGTAAHVEREAAILAALCETIERDKYLQFWYRQPATSVIPVESICDRDLRATLHDVQTMGYVVTVCRLEYDLQLPCYLVLALRHDTVAYGLGCHPIRTEALRHAVAEFRGNILALQNSPLESVAYQPLCNVHWPADHYALYNRGPLHHVLRQVLTHVLHVDVSATWTSAPTSIVAGGSPLAAALAVLEANGYRALACDITPIALAECGVSVIRILVPGLIPLHFGHDRLRLGCSRLRESSADGRLATLLPHFLH